ncbi:hypothetical protein T01_4056 [Trichinella spiralis]|uniref:Uncharacterized protein n=1 Tax=Trichinella spiralis TaxID=6334 RepID=A0A0V1BH61_TRISP|nr:hypothetical protein T01_4056 [Trichinella spiralis]
MHNSSSSANNRFSRSLRATGFLLRDFADDAMIAGFRLIRLGGPMLESESQQYKLTRRSFVRPNGGSGVSSTAWTAFRVSKTLVDDGLLHGRLPVP